MINQILQMSGLFLIKKTYKVKDKIKSGLPFDTCLEPQYKWLLLFPRHKRISVYRRADLPKRTVYDRVDSDGHWSDKGLECFFPNSKKIREKEPINSQALQPLYTVL